MAETDQLHEFFGGRKRVDRRFWDDENAVGIRQRMVSVGLEKGFNSREIAKEIGESSTSLSLAAGGRLGTRRLEEIRVKLEALNLEPVR